MKLSKAIKPISYIKKNAAEIMKELDEGGGPYIITQNGEAKAVLQSVREYEDMQEALAMLKVLKMSEESLENGKGEPFREVFKELSEELEK
jgi:prevent-host-death family protein